MNLPRVFPTNNLFLHVFLPCKDKQFAEMMDMMTATPKWTLRPWKKAMEGQLDSWSMYIPGVSGSTEVQQIKNFKGKF
jgi:hypothetical protein